MVYETSDLVKRSGFPDHMYIRLQSTFMDPLSLIGISDYQARQGVIPAKQALCLFWAVATT
jgi:hypothetical protein